MIEGPIHKIDIDWTTCPLYIKRLDLIQSWASGNKYYKLKYNIQFALENNISTLVSKGGMYSNHLLALANACEHFTLKCVCVVRSYAIDENNPVIKKLRSQKAELIFLPPEVYKTFGEQDAEKLFPGSYFIPEGGCNEFGIEGASELCDEIDFDKYNHLVIAGGTMTMAAGILSKAPSNANVIIVPAWKGCTRDYVNDLLVKFNINVECKWELWPDYHFGGFGKTNAFLSDFIDLCCKQTGIPLDRVYNGKMMFGIKEKMKAGYFSENDKLLAIQTSAGRKNNEVRNEYVNNE